jgi:hypothetical protein
MEVLHKQITDRHLGEDLCHLKFPDLKEIILRGGGTALVIGAEEIDCLIIGSERSLLTICDGNPEEPEEEGRGRKEDE